jgi:hypothetical protein
MRTRTTTGILLLSLFLSLSTLVAIAQTETNIHTGTINDELPFVQIPLTVEDAGSTVIVDIQPTSGDLDTLLYLVDAGGAIVAENDDRAEGDFSSLIEYLHAEPGDYTVIATRYSVMEGVSSGDFELMLEVSLPEAADEHTYAVSDEDLLAAGFPAIEPHEEAEWTIIAYYGGDTNLEAGILNDFNEFELGGGSNETVRVLMLLDRHPEFSDTSGDWETVRLFEVGADVSGDEGGDAPPTIDTQELADLGELDTGDGQTLAQYLTWVVRAYPARHYAVTLSSHGAGWSGLVTDDTDGPSILTLPELRQAFAIATEAAGVDKFDLLINDACLMSSVEYHQAMADTFHTSYASPEIVVNPALDMSLLSQLLNDDISIDLTTLGTTLVDTYMVRDVQARGGAESRYLTNAVTRLDNFAPVSAAIDRFAQLVKSDPVTYGFLLGEARSNAYTYSAFVGGDELIDLGNLMRQIIFLSTDPDMILAAEAVLQALSDAVAYANAGDQVATQTSTYHNIYFPNTSEDFKPAYFVDSAMEEWATMLRSYYNVVTPQVWSIDSTGVPFHPPIAPKVHIAGVYPTTPVSLLSPLSINLEITGRNISHAINTIDRVLPDGTVIRLLNERLLTSVGRGEEVVRINQWASGIETVDIVWDTALPVVTDGETSKTELLILTEDVASLEGRYREPGSEAWNTASLIFDLETGTLQRVINRSETDALGVITIPTGSEFQAYRAVVTPDGRVATEPGTLYAWPEDGLSWSWQPAPSGDYHIGLLVTAFGGTTGFNSTSFTIDNENVDPSLRANIRTNLGFSLARPESWSTLAFFRDDFVFRTLNDDNTENFTVYFALRDVPEEHQAVTDLIVESYGLSTGGEFTPITLADGTPALEFELTRETDSGSFSGRAFTVYMESFRVGLVFSAEVADDVADLDDLYSILLEHITLFDPITLTRQWTFGAEVENTRYPLLKTLLADDTDDAWFRYVPEGSDESGPFIALAAFDDIGETIDGALENVLTETVSVDATEVMVVENRRYIGENHTWEAVIYTAQRNEQAVQGRVYMIGLNDQFYTIWVESPDTEDASVFFADVVEPMIDGFIISEIE